MAKKSLVEKNKKRLSCAKRYRQKRSELLLKRCDKNISLEERFALQSEINSLPRDSSIARYKNRCSITGRPRGYYRRFGLSRLRFRLLVGWAKLPGVVKSSW